MKLFLQDNFLLESKTANLLYNKYAEDMPIIDYHNHLSPADIANDKQFSTITEIWLGGDHYKWRAMRANGIAEDCITGSATDEEKFTSWAATVPYTLRNPLYHWSHLELKRYFGIDMLLDETSAGFIYEACNSALQTKEFSTRNLLRRMKVDVVCTTDDPVDNLQWHQKIKNEDIGIKVLPTFRADAIVNIDQTEKFLTYVQALGIAVGRTITSYEDVLNAVKERHDYFASAGCVLSDHGFAVMYADDFDKASVDGIFRKVINGGQIDQQEVNQFKSAILYEMAIMDHNKNWAQQWHVGGLRNNASRLVNKLGADAGVDSINDVGTAEAMAKFFDRLDAGDQLSRTIIYNLNPANSEVYATMMGNYQDGTVPGKMQYGAAWWFLDQKDGIEKQLNVLSNMGLLSRFIGMLTDSRSFLSFPRHEYFRRVLCNIIGDEIEKGMLPDNIPWIGKMIQDICYNNAKQYFGF